MDKEWFTTSEVAEMLGVSVPTVWRWCKNGLIKALRTPGGQYRIPAEEVERLMKSVGD